MVGAQSQLQAGRKKENGTNGKYHYETGYDDCPHMKSFCGVQGRFFQKEPLAAGGKSDRTTGNFGI